MTTNLNGHNHELLIKSCANFWLDDFGRKEARTANSVFIVFGLMTHLAFLKLFGNFINGR